MATMAAEAAADLRRTARVSTARGTGAAVVCVGVLSTPDRATVGGANLKSVLVRRNVRRWRRAAT